MDNPNIAEAVKVLHSGGIIAYPTEAVYGLGCDPQQKTALEKLLRLKQRPAHKGFILIAATLEQLAPYVGKLDPICQQRILKSYGRPITWVVPAAQGISSLLRGNHDTLAVRVTTHPIAKALCQMFGGAIVSTSANRSGQAPLKSAFEVNECFGTTIDLVCQGQVGSLSQVTPIYDVITGSIIRR